MREIVLGKDAALKLRSGNFDLFEKDMDKGASGIYPGQFLILKDQVKGVQYLAHGYSPERNLPYIKVHGTVDIKQDEASTISSLLNRAIEYRLKFKHYQGNARLVFGASDALPGMVIDAYENAVCVTLNTCAYDPYLSVIGQCLKSHYPDKKIYFEGKNDQRLKIGHPHLEQTDKLDEIIAVEEDMRFSISPSVFQKNGFYFDHRENRRRAVAILNNMQRESGIGLDLFSYLGAWGVSFLLNEICDKMIFVDQADLQESFDKNMALNNVAEKSQFVRQDVFDFLNKEKSEGKLYDLICCDPPAFAKSAAAKKSALVGYKKLHQLNLKLLRPGGIYIAASCTHYVTIDEFQAAVHECAQMSGRSIKMLDIGIQGADHPFDHFGSKQNYIKYFMYLVE